MSNIGIYPLSDAPANIRQVRVLGGDSVGVPISPDNTTAEYKYWSDEEILTFLEVAGGNVYGAVANGFRQNAIAGIDVPESIRTDDLAVSNGKVSDKWLALAEQFETRASEVDADFAFITGVGGYDSFLPEGLSPKMYGMAVAWSPWYRGDGDC